MREEGLVERLRDYACLADLLLRHVHLQESFTYVGRQLTRSLGAPQMYRIHNAKELLNRRRDKRLLGNANLVSQEPKKCADVLEREPSGIPVRSWHRYLGINRSQGGMGMHYDFVGSKGKQCCGAECHI